MKKRKKIWTRKPHHRIHAVICYLGGSNKSEAAREFSYLLNRKARSPGLPWRGMLAVQFEYRDRGRGEAIVTHATPDQIQMLTEACAALGFSFKVS